MVGTTISHHEVLEKLGEGGMGVVHKGRLGEERDPETHLIPLLLRAVRTGEPTTLFGDDCAARDGTCVRDHVQVGDLSVREVPRAVEEVTGRKVPFVMGSRRAGDAAVLEADSSRLSHAFGWQPRFMDLCDIVSTAWEFEKRRG